MKRLLSITLLLLVAFALNAIPLRILHTNDTHGSYQPQTMKSGELIGGYPAIEYYLNAERKSAARSIYLDAGDQQTGSMFSSLTYEGLIGGAVIKTFNMLKLDASTFGNHEFDQTFATTQGYFQKANYPFVSTTLQTKDGKPFGGVPYKIITLDSLRVVIMGLSLVELSEKVRPSNIAALNILPYKQAIDQYIDEVDRQSDLIVLITHLGYEADSLLATTLDNRVDVIVGGHSHVGIDEPWQVNGIYITSTGSHTIYLGEMDIDVVNDRIASFNSRLIPLIVPKELPLTPLNQFVDGLAKSIDAEMGKPIATIPEDWKPDKFKATHLSEWVAGALFLQYQEFKPDVAIINNGGFRKSILAGDVTLRDMHELIPFNNYVLLFSCYGRDLLTMDAKNQQLAIDKPYDIVQTANSGWAIGSWGGDTILKKAYVVGSKPIDPNKLYRVVSHDYVSEQWDKYLGFQPLDVQETGDLVLDAVIEQLVLQFGKK
ncbi:bifunctional UDP-sugar hydrolase/5'-nucleotidase [Candidatus Cloacimonadota bacterium]